MNWTNMPLLQSLAIAAILNIKLLEHKLTRILFAYRSTIGDYLMNLDHFKINTHYGPDLEVMKKGNILKAKQCNVNLSRFLRWEDWYQKTIQ